MSCKAMLATYGNNADKDGGYLCQVKPWGLPKQIRDNRGYLSKPLWINTGATFVKQRHGGFLSKLDTTGATYQNNLDKDRGYICQIK